MEMQTGTCVWQMWNNLIKEHWIILNYKQYMDIRCKSDKLGKNLDQRGEEFNTSEKIQKYAEKIYKIKVLEYAHY